MFGTSIAWNGSGQKCSICGGKGEMQIDVVDEEGDCDHYPIREATLRTYNSFWEKHREDLNIAETIHYMEVFL